MDNVKDARWAWDKDGDHYCSVCKKKAFKKRDEELDEDSEVTEWLTPFCPWCGTKLYG